MITALWATVDARHSDYRYSCMINDGTSGVAFEGEGVSKRKIIGWQIKIWIAWFSLANGEIGGGSLMTYGIAKCVG